MISPRQLALVAAELESDAGVSNTAHGRAGYWLRIALALEELAGQTSTANHNMQGYMLRAARAIEVLSSASGTGYNKSESGYARRLIASFAILNSATYNQSVGVALLAAATAYEAP